MDFSLLLYPEKPGMEHWGAVLGRGCWREASWWGLGTQALTQHSALRGTGPARPCAWAQEAELRLQSGKPQDLASWSSQTIRPGSTATLRLCPWISTLVHLSGLPRWLSGEESVCPALPSLTHLPAEPPDPTGQLAHLHHPAQRQHLFLACHSAEGSDTRSSERGWGRD